MTTLEAAETEDSISAILSLLGMGMKTVPKNVLKYQFGHATKIFMEILKKYASEENFLILRHVKFLTSLCTYLMFFIVYSLNFEKFVLVHWLSFCAIKSARSCCVEQF